MSALHKIALAQGNFIPGDLSGNMDQILAAQAQAKQADIVVFSEMCLSGYPGEDIVLRAGFQDAIDHHINDLASAMDRDGPALVIGAPWRQNGRLYNAAIVLDSKRIMHRVTKHHLPNYGVFDERRWFTPGPKKPDLVSLRGLKFHIMICEDMWVGETSPMAADMILVLNGSPYDRNKHRRRLDYASIQVRRHGCPLIYVNQVGGQDELVFDGASFAMAKDGLVVAQMPAWDQSVMVTQWDHAFSETKSLGLTHLSVTPYPNSLEADYQALVVGLADYAAKNDFSRALISLSGGIDSAFSAALAVDALGADNVECVMLESPYTSSTSLDDARDIAKRLGIDYQCMDIAPLMQRFEQTLPFAKNKESIVYENMQARLRGMMIMGIANQSGALVVSTGNKSELAVGYATLYGDMCGGFAPLKDVYKTRVYALAKWRNQHQPFVFGTRRGPKGIVFNDSVLTKPPSAELRANQKDSDCLPDYDQLDGILQCLVEDNLSVAKTTEHGYDRGIVTTVWELVLRAEYKRRQAPPGIKISHCLFGRDRRYPISVPRGTWL